MAELEIYNARVLLAEDQVELCPFLIEGGHFVHIGDGAGKGRRRLNAQGLLALPGMVDLHGDSFERQIMPRPGIFFDTRLGVFETDRQMVSNGITTAYHGITYSWEPGLRSTRSARAFIECLDLERSSLACDTRVHLRFETFNVGGINEIAGWIERGKIDVLAFNDHMSYIGTNLEIGRQFSFSLDYGFNFDDMKSLMGNATYRF